MLWENRFGIVGVVCRSGCGCCGGLEKVLGAVWGIYRSSLEKVVGVVCRSILEKVVCVVGIVGVAMSSSL